MVLLDHPTNLGAAFHDTVKYTSSRLVCMPTLKITLTQYGCFYMPFLVSVGCVFRIQHSKWASKLIFNK